MKKQNSPGLGLTTEASLASQGYEIIIGCDEVGRGCLAGSVVAAAVAVDMTKIHVGWAEEPWTKEVKDSKLLSAKKRCVLATVLQATFPFAVGSASSEEIDRINIHQATLLAIQRAVDELRKKLNQSNSANTHLLIDGSFLLPAYRFPQTAITDGDVKVFSIAAASIVAKVYRDNLMVELDAKFPGYDFISNKGYGTAKHFAAIKKLGTTKHHRQSFTLFHETSN